ncbi:MAG: DUF1698 domain-containing protein [Pegethrix bostrychoides GSE-TBD4-15B]|jgi:hypothetical protein|uniref:DUF1698 domain-containing protein n=1 Tax=Pegethrix bostrychoides GSE-TBD4-15B TaxID=2839662 RepID=A0A951PB29_9CYAN|nr:DUF1698 domain-containing protein [Pegethrix bostrychoides GSE-TBD4-15B]
MEILDQYLHCAPADQNCLDIFKGEWASKMPLELTHLNAGTSPLFEDSRIHWISEQFGGFQNKKILELGPLEAGHTYMLERMGAASITAVEANIRAYLKCLVIKEMLGLKSAHFLLGDFVEYLKQQTQKFDICVASGVLYHMKNPAELLFLLSQVSERIFLWTHYYDAAILQASPQIASRFSDEVTVNYKGFCHSLHRQEYREALGFSGFCGGSLPFSSWMERSDIIAYLKLLGLTNIQIEFDHPNHPNGPCFAIAASR